MNKWKRKAEALTRLAEDQRGNPEGDLARQKLLEIIKRHPEASDYGPVKRLVERDFMMSDLKFMYQHGISTGGQWTAEDMDAAVEKMIADYWKRIEEWKNRPKELEE